MEENNNIPGKGAATASLVLGIISVVLWFFGYSALVSVILGIVGLILAGNAKKAGFNGGIRTAGFVLSLIGLIGARSSSWPVWPAWVRSALPMRLALLTTCSATCKSNG